MRHKYVTPAIVLGRSPIGEASTLVVLLTRELGILRARAQGLRKPGAKLASALQTLSGADVTLVRGKEGWRLSGAILTDNHFDGLTPDMRARAGRIASLMTRLVSGDSEEEELYRFFEELLHALPGLPEEEQDEAEIAAALSLLLVLGLDAGESVPRAEGRYGPQALAYVRAHRKRLIERVNRGIEASGL